MLFRAHFEPHTAMNVFLYYCFRWRTYLIMNLLWFLPFSCHSGVSLALARVLSWLPGLSASLKPGQWQSIKLNTLYMQIKVSKRLFSLSAFYHSFFVWWQSRIFCGCSVFSLFVMRFIHEPPARILGATLSHAMTLKNWLINWLSNVLTFQHINLPKKFLSQLNPAQLRDWIQID